MATAQLQKVSYSHDAMVDLILQDPTVTANELAQVFNYSPGWVTRILASDSFQARVAQRKAALVDPILSRSINQRLNNIAIRSMDVIAEKLEAEPSAAYAMEALQVVTQGLSAIAIGQSRL